MPENLSSSLLILGNGFDLQCKLPSKFSDFFETKKKFVESAMSSYQKCNIWYLMLYFAFYDRGNAYSSDGFLFERIDKNNVLWMDVEGFIKKIFTTTIDKDDWMKNHISHKNYISLFEKIFNENRRVDYIDRYTQQVILEEQFSLHKQIKKYIDVYDFLYHQLREFENDFKDYLSNYLEENEEKRDEYLKNVKNLFKKIQSKDNEEAFSIITFNYTIIDSAVSSFYSYGNVTNIHGDLNGDIIIGFDSSDLIDNNTKDIKLSKSWQKMILSTDQYKLPDKESIASIKFYGHSLGEQDYSYFHAIFDYYDIYHSSIRLIFYYSNYEDSGEKNELNRQKYISSIYSLLNNYAIKSGNEQSVKTIISKLQLENRLQIKLI